MADPGLDLERQHIEHADGGALTTRTRGGGYGDQRTQSVDRRDAPAHRDVDVVHQFTWVRGQQVDRLGRIDRRPAPDRDVGVPRTALTCEVDRLTHAVVGGFDMGPVEDAGLDSERLHLLGDPVRVPGSRNLGVGDDQDPVYVVLRKVETDLPRRASTELECRGRVSEYALSFGRGREMHQPSCPATVSACLAALSSSSFIASSTGTQAACSVEESCSMTRGSTSREPS